MKTETRPLGDNVAILEPADTTNVELLVQWTLDPIAQGPHKHVPDMTEEAGFREEGLLPHSHYRVHRAKLSEQPCLLFIKPRCT